MNGVSIFHEILYLIIVGCISVVVKYITNYLNEKKIAIQKETEEIDFQNTMMKAIEVIEKVIETTSQTYVDSLKKSGDFTDEAQAEALKKTVDNIMLLLPDEAKALIEVTFHDLEKWVTNYVESYLRASKKEEKYF